MNRHRASQRFDHGDLVDLDMESLRADFRRERRQRRLSQSQVAALLNVSQATVSAFEKGKHDAVHPKTLCGIHEMVVFWGREAEDGSNSHAHDVGVIIHDNAEDSRALRCRRCATVIPRLELPPRFCPYCSATLGSLCNCGNRSLEPEAVFCSRCGALLRDDRNEKMILESQTLREVIRNRLVRWAEKSELVSQLLEELVEALPVEPKE